MEDLFDAVLEFIFDLGGESSGPIITVSFHTYPFQSKMSV